MNANIWLQSFIVAIVLFQIVSIPALLLKKNDLADVLWGPAFPLAAFAGLYFGSGETLLRLDLRSWMIFGALTFWAVRLFLHVGVRNLSTVKEDVRYNNWRKQWGDTQVWRSYLQVFVLQPLILFVFLTPVILCLSSASVEIGPITIVGYILWMCGFMIETISDEQLRQFKKEPASKGKLMTMGLWGWSRHPNYFGEVTMWWGMWLMVLELPYGWATIVSPIGVTFLILKVSGVDMLENLMKSRPGYAEYAAKTPKFFPRPPKRGSSEK